MFKRQANKWIRRRIPASDDIHLIHRNLFILPSGFGVSLLGCIVLLFLLGTNYQNNPVLLMSYLMLAWMLVSMVLCFFNLNQSRVKLGGIQPVHSGEHLEMPITVECQSTRSNWRFIDDKNLLAELQNVKSQVTNQVCLKMPKRGHQSLPRIRLESRYPFGLFVCWSYLRFEQKVWVYPKAEVAQWQLVSLERESSGLEGSSEQDAHQVKTPDTLDFEGIREYQLGESLSRVSWKHQARNPEQNLLVKTFTDLPQSANWLGFESIQMSSNQRRPSLEQSLSQLTFALLQLDSSQHSYGVHLSGYNQPVVTLAKNQGRQHLQRSLETLAVYGLAKGSDDEG